MNTKKKQGIRFKTWFVGTSDREGSCKNRTVLSWGLQ